MRRLFLILAAALFGLPAVSVVASVVPSSTIKKFSVGKLHGATNPAEPPVLTWAAFLDGSFQAKAGPWLAERMGRPREGLIRISNGMAYLFGRLTVPTIVAGPDGTLFETPYIDDWCRRPVAVQADRIAARLFELQTSLRQSGKTFLFVISPSKAAVYPELLPKGCHPPAEPRPYDLVVKALSDRGVAFLDGSALLKAARQSQPWPVFGRNGTHWNELGAAFVTRAILAETERQLGRPISQVEVSHVEVDSKPFDEENDLANLLNLPIRARAYPSPHPRFKTVRQDRPPRLLVVGSSFAWQITRILAQERVVDELRHYYYFSRILDYRNGRLSPLGPPHQAPGDLPAALPAVDSVILEANEAYLVSPHVEDFTAAVLSLHRTQ